MEGRRLVTLVTAYWIYDTILRKKVLPPWRAVHFPLPAIFDPPCTNMILTTTGFESRDKDFIKDMIRMVGASHTGLGTLGPSRLHPVDQRGRLRVRQRCSEYEQPQVPTVQA